MKTATFGDNGIDDFMSSESPKAIQEIEEHFTFGDRSLGLNINKK